MSHPQHGCHPYASLTNLTCFSARVSKLKSAVHNTTQTIGLYFGMSELPTQNALLNRGAHWKGTDDIRPPPTSIPTIVSGFLTFVLNWGNVFCWWFLELENRASWSYLQFVSNGLPINISEWQPFPLNDGRKVNISSSFLGRFKVPHFCRASFISFSFYRLYCM